MQNQPVLLLVLLVFLAFTTCSRAQLNAPPSRPAPLAELLHYEPTGLSLLTPYAKGKIPVLFIHRLWVSPSSWHRMIAKLEEDPAIAGRYQFWTFGYSTGDPIPYSAHLLRQNMEELRRKLDPDGSDAALDQMVLVGHSMGGLLTKMIASKASDRLWRVVSDRPDADLQGERSDVELFRSGLLFAARPEVRRVVYIATPHRGSRFDRGAIERIGMRLVGIPDPLRAAHRRLVESNGDGFFRDHFRKALPTSIEELEWGSPLITGHAELAPPPSVRVHSIIAVRPESPRGDRTDGLVTYESAHVAGAETERVIATGHLCQDHPEVIGEVRRILAEHAKF
ncbi:Alpha/beta hydrolase family protein [Singulisphaera sp. GP187]|uniref:esterase/lipase family protein n=1 Tax=Singulisphaera sp. GP187 TaxID=1882752 RepID=UPI00092A6C13|nr:alpha/beta hydrolase [Singulisphaera sp. GP187]SIO65232.1 Alpha/beta hydrolase family protein [Singulisphaera sp. GP187]